MKFIAPTWDQIYRQSIHLARKIKKDKYIDCLIGVSRGGLVLSRIMSDLLDVQDVRILKCEYYSDVCETNRKPRITQGVQRDIAGKHLLILDDVADTGESLTEIKKYLKSKKPSSTSIATIYVKPWSKVLPDYHVRKTSAWIVFPWELHETIKLLSAKNLGVDLARTHIPRNYAGMLYKLDDKLGKL